MIICQRLQQVAFHASRRSLGVHQPVTSKTEGGNLIKKELDGAGGEAHGDGLAEGDVVAGSQAGTQ